MSTDRTAAGAARRAQMGRLKFWPAKRALSPSSSSILEDSESLFNCMDPSACTSAAHVTNTATEAQCHAHTEPLETFLLTLD